MLSITNDAGRRFQVFCIRKGTRYGVNKTLLHEGDAPLIAFTEVARDGEASQPPAGPFLLCQPAHLLLRLCDDPYLWLFGANVAWRLGPKQLRQVRDWIVANCPD